MRKYFFCLLMLLGCFFGIPQALAIATANNSISASNPTNHGYSVNWDYIYRCNNSSSVAVDHYWVLTAAHVADDGVGTLSVNGETYTRQEVIYHDTADLALERYDKPFPGYYLLHDGEIFTQSGSGRNRITVYDELLMMGFGRTGVVTSVSFSNGPYGNGLKRWGTNKGSSTLSTTIPSGDLSTTCFPTTFILGETAYEAGAAQYDSGGPVFINSGGDWKIAGINLYLSGTSPNYTGNWLGKISAYRDWIISNIPDYDSDMDGLPDWWETQYDATEAGDDPDSDGLTNLGEFQNETDPLDWDSDDDSMPDGWEVDNGLNPTDNSDENADPDSDGFSNSEEWIADTDPMDGISCLKIDEFANVSQVVFGSSTSRQYQVEYRTDLADSNETWQAEPGLEWFTADSTQTVKAVSSSSSNRFYRLQVTLP